MLIHMQYTTSRNLLQSMRRLLFYSSCMVLLDTFTVRAQRYYTVTRFISVSQDFECCRKSGLDIRDMEISAALLCEFSNK